MAFVCIVPSTWNVLCFFALNSYSFFKTLLRLHLFFKVVLPLPLPSLSSPSPDTYSSGLRNAGLLFNLMYVRPAPPTSWISMARVEPGTCVMILVRSQRTPSKAATHPPISIHFRDTQHGQRGPGGPEGTSLSVDLQTAPPFAKRLLYSRSCSSLSALLIPSHLTL